ncbi:hypothetical protein [Geoglobus ahangari]
MSFERLLERHGVSVTLRSATKTVVDDIYGVEKTAYTDTTIKAIFSMKTERDELKVQGYTSDGKTVSSIAEVDAVCYVLPTSQAKQFDRIIYDNTTYEVVRVDKAILNGNVVYLKLFLKRIEE